MYTHDVAQKGYEDQRQITRAVRSEILKSMVIPIRFGKFLLLHSKEECSISHCQKSTSPGKQIQ